MSDAYRILFRKTHNMPFSWALIANRGVTPYDYALKRDFDATTIRADAEEWEEYGYSTKFGPEKAIREAFDIHKVDLDKILTHDLFSDAGARIYVFPEGEVLVTDSSGEFMTDVPHFMLKTAIGLNNLDGSYFTEGFADFDEDTGIYYSVETGEEIGDFAAVVASALEVGDFTDWHDDYRDMYERGLNELIDHEILPHVEEYGLSEDMPTALGGLSDAMLEEIEDALLSYLGDHDRRFSRYYSLELFNGPYSETLLTILRLDASGDLPISEAVQALAVVLPKMAQKLTQDELYQVYNLLASGNLPVAIFIFGNLSRDSEKGRKEFSLVLLDAILEVTQ